MNNGQSVPAGGYAFPHKPEVRQSMGPELVAVTPGDQPSMTLRDYFAAKAMAAFLASTEWEFEPAAPIQIQVTTDIALSSYRMADAMLKARSS